MYREVHYVYCHALGYVTFLPRQAFWPLGGIIADPAYRKKIGLGNFHLASKVF